jgi:ligand-binding sensor domain-containing protein
VAPIGRRAALVSGLALALALWAGPAAALDPARALTQYVRDAWGLKEGLPQLSVPAMAQTSDGYLWLATEEGLVRFDGLRFTVFDEENLHGLRSRSIEALAVAADGALWIGTNGGGVGRLQGGVVTPGGSPPDLANEVVLSILAEKTGDVWVGTKRGGLAQLHGGSWRRYRTADGMPSDEVMNLERAADGGVWVGTSAGVARVKGGSVRRYDISGGASAVDALRLDLQGRVWLGARGRGLFRLEGDQFEVVAGTQEIANKSVLAILDDRDGNLWLGTDAGLRRWANGRLVAFGPRGGQAADTVLSLWEDHQGALWAGTLGTGLTRFRDGDFATYSTEESLPHDFVRSVSEDARGDVWIGSRGGGLARLREERITPWGSAEGVPHSFVYAVLSTRDGSLWVGTYGAGLIRLRGGKATAFKRAQGLPSEIVRALYEDSSGTLWVGCEGGGLARWDGTSFRTYTARDGLADDTVYAVLEDRRSDLWVATNEGLSRMRNGAFTTYRTTEGLSGNLVRSLYEDASGALWIGTLTGLSRLHEGRIFSFWRKQGIADAVFAILEDGQGRFWLSGNRGVLQVRRAELESVAAGQADRVRSRLFGAADGLKSPECNGGVQPAGWKARDGRLWFATMKGAAVVDPSRLRARSRPPAPILEAASADGRSVDLRGAARVPPGDGRLELTYTSASLSDPEALRFLFRLDGFDRDWVDAGHRRVAYYTNLPPGRYRFRLKACGPDDTCSDEVTSAELQLAPRFVQTWAFVVLCSLGAALAAWSGHRYRVRRLHLHEEELHRRIDDAVSRIKVLSGLLPICAWCKKVRDDRGYWSQIEAYVSQRTEAEFTHGICPECQEGMRPKARK